MRTFFFFVAFLAPSSTIASSEFQFPTEREIAIASCGAHADMSYVMVTFRLEGKTKDEIRAWASRGLAPGPQLERQMTMVDQWTDELFDHPQDQLLEFPVIRMSNCLQRDPRIGIPYDEGYRCYDTHMRKVTERTFGPNRQLPLPAGLGPAARKGFADCLELAARAGP